MEPTQIYDVGLTNTFQILDTPLRAHYYAVNGAKLDSTCPGLSPFEVTSCGPQYGSRGGHATNGIMYPLSAIRHKQITDGTSKTFLVGECSWDFGGDVAPWYAGLAVFWRRLRSARKAGLVHDEIRRRLLGREPGTDSLRHRRGVVFIVDNARLSPNAAI